MEENDLFGIDENGNRQPRMSMPPITIKYLRNPMTTPSVSPTFMVHIGYLILSWGMAEQRIDALIDRTYAGLNKTPENGWGRLNFRKRISLLKKNISFGLALYPKPKKYLTDILNEAAQIYWKRNILAHGTVNIKLTFPKNSLNAYHSCIAKGRHNGVDRTEEFLLDDIQKMWHDLCHLAAVMDDLMGSFEHASRSLSSRDIQKLQEFLATDRQNLSKAPTP